MPPTLYCRQVVTIVRGTEVERKFLNYSTCTSGNGGLMTIRCFRRRVTRVVVLLVDVLETSFRQVLQLMKRRRFGGE